MVTSLLDSGSARRAKDVLRVVAEHLLLLEPEDALEGSLSGGTAGLALVHAALAPLFPEQPHRVAARAALAHAASVVRRDNAWLASGAAGIGFVETIAETGVVALDELDERVLAALNATAPPVELLYGASGIVVYALQRSQCSAGAAMVDRFVDRALAAAVPEGDGIVWRAEQSTPSEPRVDLGFAHGMPGTLAALARVLATSDRPAAIETLLRRACAGFLAYQRGHEVGTSSFGHDSRTTATLSLSAWCYGDCGAGWGLLLAARALRDPAIEARALAVLERAAKRTFEQMKLEGPGFCHGTAGAAHVFHRIARLTNRQDMAACARALVERTLDACDVREPLAGISSHSADGSTAIDASYLMGAAGVALVLADALGCETPPWDASFMMAPRGG
jgi:lantibiotic modifying enzyme